MIASSKLYAGMDHAAGFSKTRTLQGDLLEELLDDLFSTRPLGTPGFTILDSQLLELMG
ncbi:MAG: hypothetical protein AB7P76_00010 [Candidatus Melainabacteria bacterium]